MPRELPAWITPEIIRLSYFRLSISGRAMLQPMAMPATLRPFIAEISTISRIVPMARPPRSPPVRSCTIA